MMTKALRTALLLFLCATALLAQAPLSGGAGTDEFTHRLVAAAVARASVKVRYVADYVHIPYPNGDVPADTGTCADEIIRIYRAVGIDLQKQVHEDMLANLDSYPRKGRWDVTRLDSSIDHRRVPNLMVYFQRHGQTLPMSRNPHDYLPGDIVAWDLGGGVTHIGMVVDRKPLLWNRYEILHNIGEGPKIEDELFSWKIIGHYRYYGPGH